jgi:ubiquitin-activating enzyme E1
MSSTSVPTPMVDNDRYSRQSYSIGQDVMCKLSKAVVLIVGYSTLSLEIIKNMTLLGINCINIHSSKKLDKYQQTGMYYKYRDKLPLEDFKKLNPGITIEEVNIYDEDNELNVKLLKKYNMVILTNSIFDDAINLNRITHKLNIPFIMTGCYGLMGYVFNDWGENFVINDVDGDIYENLLIESIQDKIIKFKDGHNLSDGDILICTLQNLDGSTSSFEIQVKETKTPLIVEMKEDLEKNINLYKSLIKKKIPKNIKFKSLKQNYQSIDAIIADYSLPFTRSTDLHELNLAYSQYLETVGETPRSWSNVDFEIFTQYIKSWESKSEEFKILAKKFCFTLRGDVLPVASIIASVASHEVLKALGHKYQPIVQWYYMDYYELIENSEVIGFKESCSKKYKSSSKYEGLINVFGKDILESIQKTKPFIIGSGAIGCELVKNLGMFGVKEMYLTDMDYIEKSNLSRQFLFNDDDIRKSKAQTAAKKIKLMNSDSNVIVYEQKVCKETENIFDKNFHKKIDVYLNALDNQDARIYVDQLAIKYTKPLIDSGTTGGKGNVQVVVPHLTESYSSTKDPDDKVGIPICTIKSFPFKQAHTIQWARELFETEFNEIPCKIQKYFVDKNLEFATPSEISSFIKQLYKYRDFSISKEGYHKVLSHIFVENFDYGIKELLKKYSDPEKKSEIDGKVLPSLLNYQTIKTEIDDFMIFGFNLMSQLFGTKLNYNPTEFTLLAPDAFDIDYDKLAESHDFSFANKIINTISPIIKKIDFEKDDDSLGHVQWLLIVSNLRNHQYKIEKSDLFNTRKIAGNIIPAMITTTSLVSGYQILEYIKIIKFYKSTDKNCDKTKINFYKNRFVNLNTNYIDGTTPAAATFEKLGNLNFSLWDRIEVDTNSIEKIMEFVYKLTGKKVEYLMHGNEVIFDGDDIYKNYVDLDTVNLVSLIEDIPTEVPIYMKQ